MRVLTAGNMYPPHHLGGYELMWHSWVKHARAAGHEVRVLTTDYRNPAPDVAAASPDAHRELRWYWREHDFPRLKLRERRALERHNQSVLARHLEAFEPNAVCWWAMGGMSLALLERVRRLGVAAAAVVVDDWLVYGPKVDAWQRAFGRPRALAAAVERLTGVPTRLDLDHCARWVCVSERVRDRARAEGYVLPDAIVANAGIDPAAFPPAPAQKWRWRLLYVGRIDARKGIATAIRALVELPEATLTVVGGGDERHLEELEELARVLGLAGRVRFERHSRDQLAGVYAQADAAVFPVAWAEPWGLVPLEAMSVGRPVIATGTGGSGEYLRDGENCLIFSPKDDPGALAAAVRRLAVDEDLRATLREGGFETAARYTEASFNEAVLAAIEDGRG